MEYPNIKSISIVPNPVAKEGTYHITVEFYSEPYHGTTPDIRASVTPELYAGEGGGLL